MHLYQALSNVWVCVEGDEYNGLAKVGIKMFTDDWTVTEH